MQNINLINDIKRLQFVHIFYKNHDFGRVKSCGRLLGILLLATGFLPLALCSLPFLPTSVSRLFYTENHGEKEFCYFDFGDFAHSILRPLATSFSKEDLLRAAPI